MQPWNEDAFVSKLIPVSTAAQTNNSCTSEYIYESNDIRITRLTAEAFLALVGVVFNVCICVLNLKHSSINAALKVYIRNMAFADIGVLLFGFPFAVAKEQEGTRQWILGSIACKYVYPITETFYTVSIWSLVAIAIERCRIMKASRSTWRRRPSRALRYLFVVWITAFVVISLPILLASHYGSACGKKYCFVRWPSANDTHTIPSKVHSFSLFFILFIVPVGVVVWSYCKMSVSHRRGVCTRLEAGPRHRRLQSDNSENTNPSLFTELDEAIQQECDEAKRFLTPLVILFLITTVPMNILRVIFIFRSTKTSLEQYLVLLNLSIMLSICNSVVRPFIYYMVSHDVRVGFKRLVSKVKQGLRRGWGEHHDEMVPLQEIRHTNYKETTL